MKKLSKKKKEIIASTIEVSEKSINHGLIKFIQDSPTPFHAARTIEQQLLQNHYQQLDEGKRWRLTKGGKYYLKRNGSSIIALSLSKKSKIEDGFRMIGAHTDAPSLKIKPNPHKKYKGHFQTTIEVYGGPLLHTWFDRDLSLAGRITFLDKK